MQGKVILVTGGGEACRRGYLPTPARARSQPGRALPSIRSEARALKTELDRVRPGSLRSCRQTCWKRRVYRV